MNPPFRLRLPFALLGALIMGIGYRVADTSMPWQIWIVGSLSTLAFLAPVIIQWSRERRAAKGDGSEPDARA